MKKSVRGVRINNKALLVVISTSLSACQNGIQSIAGPAAVVTSGGAGVNGYTPITPTALASIINASYGTTGTDLQAALGGFSNSLYTNQKTTQMQMRDARNTVAYHLMGISNTLCGKYEESLKEKSSNVTFFLGSLATAFGGAGAIFTNATASVFSGLAGVTSGVNAEYSKDFFQSIATSIIIPGIEKQRTALAQEMAQRMCYGITTYPLPMAIADVIRYNNACTMDKGIAATSQSINQSNTIGLDTLQSTLAALDKLKSSSGGKTTVIPAAGTTTTTTTTTTAPPASSASGSTTPSPLGSGVTLTDCPGLGVNGELQSTTTETTTRSTTTKTTPASPATPDAAAPVSPVPPARLSLH